MYGLWFTIFIESTENVAPISKFTCSSPFNIEYFGDHRILMSCAIVVFTGLHRIIYLPTHFDAGIKPLPILVAVRQCFTLKTSPIFISILSWELRYLYTECFVHFGIRLTILFHNRMRLLFFTELSVLYNSEWVVKTSITTLFSVSLSAFSYSGFKISSSTLTDCDAFTRGTFDFLRNISSSISSKLMFVDLPS